MDSNSQPFDDQKLWNELLTFKHHDMIAMKNLDNDLATESWDSLFHTGLFLAMSALRLERLNDQNIANEIESTLKVILDNGVTFRGFNSPGEYWSGHNMTKYYPIWHDKEVFGDVSRDQIISLNFGLFFIHNFVPKDYARIHNLKERIVGVLVEQLEEAEYDLGTTYGDCKTFQVPFRLFYNLIIPEAPLKTSENNDEWEKSLKYMTMALKILRFIPIRQNYFSNNLVNLLLFLFFSSIKSQTEYRHLDVSSLIAADEIKEIEKNYKKWLKKRIKDNNLFFELCYRYATGEYIFKRDFLNELNEIFSKMPEKKVQDFIWQRHPKDWYNPKWGKGVVKNFYAPWHDYLLVFEMIKKLEKEES